MLGWSSTGSDGGGQGWYDLAFTADPANAETIYVGGVNTWKSTNGGTNWSIKSHWAGAPGVQTVHADIHDMEWQNSVLWEGNDGGLYKSVNGGNTWNHMSNGMVISQMYKLGVSQTDTKVIAGLQDNGTKLMDNNGSWSDEIGGDGMECAINKDLKKAININDRFVFIKELFRGDENMYERSIKTINGFSIYAEAEYWIRSELKLKLGWNDENELVKHFEKLVKRRFAQ